MNEVFNDASESKKLNGPEVLYEDNHLIALNKKSSDLSQGDASGDLSLDARVKQYLAAKYDKPGDVFLGVVHRLDRPVSGVILYARTSKALSRMNEMFRQSLVKKTYLAIVGECPPEDEGVLIHYLRKNEKQNKSYVFDREVAGSRKAVLTYRIAGRSQRYYLLEIGLHSGRHHQIRAQLAAIGCPVKGDLKYGYRRANENGGISLFARKLEFIHPVRKVNTGIVAPFPEGDLWRKFNYDAGNPETEVKRKGQR
ncbi:MAG TPA: RNA pseudouridine synthase [Bacteroidales bacterium]|jgi:23S rRNA pseudouridine1911/1915/1917 synthase|nr:RNA pseudouridine synthase [Bacteroidales bacterium]HOS72093.1 RNA pseudouridine synthase [Bacteroidales bacterium]HQH25669.1 RNA pseudouridine synthase [Bacteroidales bacterium]HQJ83315.1 RNA pseudouridine synthase [Bacteroidales bacterium]